MRQLEIILTLPTLENAPNTNSNLIMLDFDIVLASASPRRKIILSQVHQNILIQPSNIDEDFTIELLPKAFCEHWSSKKAKDIAESLEPLEKQLEDLLDELNSTLRPRIEKPIRKRPLVAIGIAASLGVLLGILMSGGRKS